jgi:predicted dehydrogenase
MNQNELTRRAFLTVAAAAGTSFAARAQTSKPNTAKVVPRKISPNEKLNIAGIGAGGKGREDLGGGCRTENVVAMADVDDARAAEMYAMYPQAKKFRDYREMLDKVKEIDAVTVTTPDHTHAPAAYMAMSLGKHVYVQKPLTHTVAEARLLRDTANKMKVATQMGNQGHSGNGVRTLCEMLWSGAIGTVKEAHVWTNRPGWPQGIDAPLPEEPVPATMDWDLWIGSAPMRPCNTRKEGDNTGYAPHNWRGWQDFGNGALGDMACHIMDPAFWALHLHEAKSYAVELVSAEGRNDQTYPTKSVVKFSYPARGEMPPVDVYWYDGNNVPPRPAGVPDDQQIGEGEWGVKTNGSYFLGDKGVATAGEYGGKPRLLPDERMKDYTLPEQTIPRIDAQNHYRNWFEACKGGTPACSNFEYSAPFSEMIVLGGLAIRMNQRLEYDCIAGKLTNVANSDHLLTKEYRKGWELPI